METMDDFPKDLRGATLRYPWPAVAATGKACRLERGVDFDLGASDDALRMSGIGWAQRNGYRWSSRREGANFVWVKFVKVNYDQ